MNWLRIKNWLYWKYHQLLAFQSGATIGSEKWYREWSEWEDFGEEYYDIVEDPYNGGMFVVESDHV